MKFARLKVLDEEVESEGTWAISYGDMITLLLSFFVIFFTTDFDKNKQQGMNDHVIKELLAIDFNQKAKSKGLTSGSQVSASLDNKSLFEAIPKLEVIPVENSMVIKFTDISFFKSGQVELTPEGQQVIKAFVGKYMPYAGTYRLSVKAFTDRRKVVNINGRFKDNLELSALRAVAAMRELKKMGIPLQRMDIAGHGEMLKIQNYLKNSEKISELEKNALSRTIVMIIKPEKDETFL